MYPSKRAITKLIDKAVNLNFYAVRYNKKVETSKYVRRLE